MQKKNSPQSKSSKQKSQEAREQFRAVASAARRAALAHGKRITSLVFVTEDI